jgi:hypothetical protein
MSRHGFHTFTSDAPVFALEDDYDPFFEKADRAATRAPPCSRESLSPSPLRDAPDAITLERTR